MLGLFCEGTLTGLSLGILRGVELPELLPMLLLSRLFTGLLLGLPRRGAIGLLLMLFPTELRLTVPLLETRGLLLEACGGLRLNDLLGLMLGLLLRLLELMLILLLIDCLGLTLWLLIINFR